MASRGGARCLVFLFFAEFFLVFSPRLFSGMTAFFVGFGQVFRVFRVSQLGRVLLLAPSFLGGTLVVLPSVGWGQVAEQLTSSNRSAGVVLSGGVSSREGVDLRGTSRIRFGDFFYIAPGLSLAFDSSVPEHCDPVGRASGALTAGVGVWFDRLYVLLEGGYGENLSAKLNGGYHRDCEVLGARETETRLNETGVGVLFAYRLVATVRVNLRGGRIAANYEAERTYEDTATPHTTPDIETSFDETTLYYGPSLTFTLSRNVFFEAGVLQLTRERDGYELGPSSYPEEEITETRSQFGFEFIF